MISVVVGIHEAIYLNCSNVHSVGKYWVQEAKLMLWGFLNRRIKKRSSILNAFHSGADFLLFIYVNKR